MEMIDCPKQQVLFHIPLPRRCKQLCQSDLRNGAYLFSGIKKAGKEKNRKKIVEDAAERGNRSFYIRNITVDSS